MTNLINKGVFHLNSSPVSEQATIVVTGLGRSGTTMVSRVLSELSLNMGDVITPQSNEDKEIQQLVKQNQLKEFEDLCTDRNARLNKWGFKCPAVRSKINRFGSVMREPRFIILFRDLLSISIRNNIAINRDVLDTLLASNKGYENLLMEVGKSKFPMLLISYEKALQFKDETVDSIASFCGLKPTREQLSRAIDVMRNGDPAYLLGDTSSPAE